MALQSLLLAHQFRFLGGVVVPLNYSVEKRIQEPLEANIDLFNLGSFLGYELRGGLSGLLLFLFNQFHHVIRPIGPQRIRFKECRDFCVEGFFTDVGLAARLCPVLFGATVVGVAFLDFARDGAAAFGAMEKAEKGFPCFAGLSWGISPAMIQNGVRSVKKVFGDDRLMRAFIHFPRILEMAVVDGV